MNTALVWHVLSVCLAVWLAGALATLALRGGEMYAAMLEGWSAFETAEGAPVEPRWRKPIAFVVLCAVLFVFWPLQLRRPR